MRLAELLRSLARGLSAPPKHRGTENPLEEMVEHQLRRRGIRDERILRVMSQLDRRLFVGEQWRDQAFRDGPIPILHGQTISQPYIVAAMTEFLEVEASHHVLEIGTGSGYQTALLASLCRDVVTVERYPELSEKTRELLGSLGFKNIQFVVGDGTLGYEPSAPYDRILLTAAPRRVHTKLLEQLGPEGVLVAPEGDFMVPGDIEGSQELRRWRRKGDRVTVEDLFAVRFVPLVEGEVPPESRR